MQKSIFTTLIVCLIATQSIAQQAFFPSTAGIVQTYAQKNDKGKIDSYSRQTISNVQVSGNEMVVSYIFEILDKNKAPKEPPATYPCKVTIKDDVVTLDMNEAFAAMQNPEVNTVVEITGIPMEISGSLKSGEEIKDSDMNMTVDLGVMKMRFNIQTTGGKCLAIEDVTVDAGTFKCHKITQTTTTTIMKKQIVTTTISWYALGIGIVKIESYDEKNKLQSSTELIQLTQ